MPTTFTVRPSLLRTTLWCASLSSFGCVHHPAAPEYVDRSTYLNPTQNIVPHSLPPSPPLEADLHRTAQPSSKAPNSETFRLWPDNVQMHMGMNCSGGMFKYDREESRSDRLCFEGDSVRARQNLGFDVRVTSF